jgi:nucleoside-diphosphate-sugar epimerase
VRVLITGIDGFIGRHLRRELSENGHVVWGVDKSAAFGGDLRVPGVIDDFLDAWTPDYCVHLAARVGRLFGEDNPLETITDNAGMTALVAKACGERGVKLAYASTSEVYGDGSDLYRWREQDLHVRDPHNAYGLSKRWGEEVCELYAPEGLVLLRFSMPYGPGHPPGRGRAALTNILDQAIRRQPIPIHRGSERSWCWIGDVVRAVRLILELGGHGAYNVGRDDNRTSMRRVAEMACEMVDASPDLIEEIDPPARQTVVKRLSNDKLRTLGWKPEVELEEGMALTVMGDAIGTSLLSFQRIVGQASSLSRGTSSSLESPPSRAFRFTSDPSSSIPTGQNRASHNRPPPLVCRIADDARRPRCGREQAGRPHRRGGRQLLPFSRGFAPFRP